jgi:hypothetical protein
MTASFQKDIDAMNFLLQQDGYISLQSYRDDLKIGEVLERIVTGFSGMIPYPLVVVGHSNADEYRRQAELFTAAPYIYPDAKYYRVVAE